MKARKQKRRKFRRGPRRRLHWGRISMLMCVIAAIIFVALWICGVFDSEKEEELEEPARIEAVAECGRRDAQKVVDSDPESFERHRAVLQIKSREHELRLNGYNQAADEYINAVKEVCK